MLTNPWVPFQDTTFNCVETYEECRVFMLNHGDTAPGCDLYAKFLAQFPHHGIAGSLPGLKFSAGELPSSVSCRILSVTAPAAQYSPGIIVYHRRTHFDARLIFITAHISSVSPALRSNRAAASESPACTIATRG